MAEENMFEQVTETQPAESQETELTFTVPKEYKPFFDQYVGDGKKYENVGELAKAYANADRHIVDLTSDVTKAKSERDNLKDLLMTNLTNEPEITPSTPPNPNDAAPQETPAQSAPPSGNESEKVDISKQIEDAIAKREVDTLRRNNALETERVMLERFENKEAAVAAVVSRAEELGLSPQYIANLAFESPKAYFELMGIDPTPPRSNNTPAPQSDVNPQRLADTNPRVKEGTYAFYAQMRTSDPARFRSAEVQNQMMKDAETNPNFYS